MSVLSCDQIVSRHGGSSVSIQGLNPTISSITSVVLTMGAYVLAETAPSAAWTLDPMTVTFQMVEDVVIMSLPEYTFTNAAIGDTAIIESLVMIPAIFNVDSTMPIIDTFWSIIGDVGSFIYGVGPGTYAPVLGGQSLSIMMRDVRSGAFTPLLPDGHSYTLPPRILEWKRASVPL